MGASPVQGTSEDRPGLESIVTGALIFVGAFALVLVATGIGLYTRRGSAINHRPYRSAASSPSPGGGSRRGVDRGTFAAYQRGTR